MRYWIMRNNENDGHIPATEIHQNRHPINFWDNIIKDEK
jgi:hypothetical protein